VSADTIQKIRDELFRLGARFEDVGGDGMKVEDRGHGNAVIQGLHGRDPDWFGPAQEILDRLSGLPDDGGPEVVRSEFA
jgi:hypothetical protein